MRRFKYWLLSLYPRAWRDRYEEEFIALLEQCTLSWLDIFDIFFYALHEQMFTLFRKGKAMLYQQRTEASLFRISLVIGSLITLGILLTSMLLVRNVIADYGTALLSSLMSCFILVVYAVVGWLAPRLTGQMGLRCGGLFGLAGGSVLLLYNVINNLGNPDSVLDTMLGNSTMIVICLLCFIAGFLAGRATQDILTGLFSGMGQACLLCSSEA
jgi:hypothetical protein